MAQNQMRWNGGRVIAFTFDQLASTQKFQRGLDSALRDTGFVCQRAQTGSHRFPLCARSLAVKPQVNKIRGGLAIVTDDIAHENVEDVIVNRDGFAEARHAKIKKEELRIKKSKMQALYR